MNRASDYGQAVFERIKTRCMQEMEGMRGCPREVFVSSRDWHDLDAYLKPKAKYEAEPAMFPTMGIQMFVDGNNLPVEIKDIGIIVLA